MALGITKAYTPVLNETSNPTSYNTDIATLFNAFSGLEAQTSSLGGLTITPSANGTGKFLVNNAAGTELFSLDTTNSYAKLKATGRFYLDGGGDTYVYEAAGNEIAFVTGGIEHLRLAGSSLGLKATAKLFLDGVACTGDTYIYEATGNIVYYYVGGNLLFRMDSNVMYAGYDLMSLSAGGVNLGNAANYFGDVSYKTLTDRGCLGYFDDGVELQDGRKVSDTQALLAIKKDAKKTTIYGVPMLDYKTFPKAAYKRAEVKGVLLERDKDDEPVGGVDGIEMTSMFSIMIGAIKELTLRMEALEKV